VQLNTRSPSEIPQATGAITDDTRVRAACPTLKYLVDNGAKVLLTSHLVRLERGTGASLA